MAPSLFKPMKSEEVPVLEILKEFRALAGIEGRNKHKGVAPPQSTTSRSRWRLTRCEGGEQ